MFLGVSTFVTIIIVAFLTMSQAKLPDFAKPKHGHTSAPGSTDGTDRVESPFKNTMAMIRWNSPHPERIPLLMKYQPFFHTVHISMPGLMPEHPPEFHNLTHDQWPGTFTVYMQLAHSMKLILDSYPEIDGLMYYHFDAWIDPLAWTGANPYTIWFPSIVDTAPPAHGGPQFMCINDTSRYNWWGWGEDFHKAAMAASNVVDHFDLEYKIKRDEWCVGWSDIYYIPRRFFADYIFLSEIFGGFGVFHEVAVPTMVHIIDQSRRRNPHRPVIDRIGDCWGSCCASDPRVEDVLWSRCGHRLNYLTQPVVDAFYNHLDEEAALLGQPLNKTRYAMASGDSLSRFDSATLKALGGDPKSAAPIHDDGLEDDQRADRLAKEQKEAKEKAEGEQRIELPPSAPPPPPNPSANPQEEADKKMNEINDQRKENESKVETPGHVKSTPPPDRIADPSAGGGQKLRRRAVFGREVAAAIAGLGY
jgi:hypothetical protein